MAKTFGILGTSLFALCMTVIAGVAFFKEWMFEHPDLTFTMVTTCLTLSIVGMAMMFGGFHLHNRTSKKPFAPNEKLMKEAFQRWNEILVESGFFVLESNQGKGPNGDYNAYFRYVVGREPFHVTLTVGSVLANGYYARNVALSPALTQLIKEMKRFNFYDEQIAIVKVGDRMVRMYDFFVDRFVTGFTVVVRFQIGN